MYINIMYKLIHWCPGWGPRPKVNMSKQSQTKNFYVQTAPDGTYLCPYFRAFKNICSFFVRSKYLISRLSCVQSYIWPDFRAFQNQNSCAHFLKISAFMSRLSCVQKHLCPDFRAFKNFRAFFERSKLSMSRLSCVYAQTFWQLYSHKLYKTFL